MDGAPTKPHARTNPVMAWIAIALLLVGVIGAALFFVPDMLRRGQMKELTVHGELAPAKVLSVGETGRRYASNPIVRFQLEVQPQGGAPFVASVEQAIPMIALPQVQPGATVHVRFDPQRRERVALVDR